jgi:predicted nucleotidyltransferase
VGLFGSFAVGQSKADSDIDIVVLIQKALITFMKKRQHYEVF